MLDFFTFGSDCLAGFCRITPGRSTVAVAGAAKEAETAAVDSAVFIAACHICALNVYYSCRGPVVEAESNERTGYDETVMSICRNNSEQILDLA